MSSLLLFSSLILYHTKMPTDYQWNRLGISTVGLVLWC